MPVSMMAHLVGQVTDVMDRADAAIDLRDVYGRYLYVNDAWAARYTMTLEQVLGRTLYELGMVPATQAKQVAAEDDIVRQVGSNVQIQTYLIFGEPVKILLIRAWLTYRGVGYMVDVSYPSDPTATPDYEIAFGELAAWRLRALEQLDHIATEETGDSGFDAPGHSGGVGGIG